MDRKGIRVNVNICDAIKKIYTAKFVNERSVFYSVPFSGTCFNMSLPTIIYISTEHANKLLESLFITLNVFFFQASNIHLWCDICLRVLGKCIQ
jgi:hypothetical protein